MAGMGLIIGVFVDLVTSPVLDAMHNLLVGWIDDMIGGSEFIGMDGLVLVCKILVWVIIYLPAPTVASAGGFVLSKKLPAV